MTKKKRTIKFPAIFQAAITWLATLATAAQYALISTVLISGSAELAVAMLAVLWRQVRNASAGEYIGDIVVVGNGKRLWKTGGSDRGSICVIEPQCIEVIGLPPNGPLKKSRFDGVSFTHRIDFGTRLHGYQTPGYEE